MKKFITVCVLAFTILLLSVFGLACKTSPYSLKFGTYGFEKATLTNKITNEIEEKDFDSIFNNKDKFREWGNLFSFQITINEDTEYFYKRNKKCYVLYEGLAFEVIGENTLQLHFPYWSGYDYYAYDIVIILCLQQVFA